MSKISLRPFVFLGLLLFMFSCDNYNKVLKSNDPEYKYKRAVEYYEAGNFFKALPLFEELISVYRGDPKLEEIYYYFSYSHYFQEQYIIAAYNFKNFVNAWPQSDKAEEMYYMHAFSMYRISPAPRLDQTYTIKAIDAFQLFVNAYPQSERVAEANKLMAEMRTKLEKKDVLAAQLYYDMGQYRAAAVSFQNILEDHPDTHLAEQLTYQIVKANYQYAKYSTDKKQPERFEDVLIAYDDLVKKYPESPFLEEAEKYKTAAADAINKSKAENNE